MNLGHWSLAVVTPSTQVVITRAELKTHLRLEDDQVEEDALLDTLTLAAQRRLEERWSRSFFQQTYDYTVDALPGLSSEPVKLPKTPLVSVGSITTYDDEDAATVWSTSEYLVDANSEPGRVLCRDAHDWPDDLRTQNAAVIRFTAGYSTVASGIPDGIKVAVRSLAARMYEGRGDTDVDLPAICRMFDDEYALPEVG